ncbi:MAG: cyclic nucleotide-binding domain-containing protein, partial [Gemmatimonadaceae bacterium]
MTRTPADQFAGTAQLLRGLAIFSELDETAIRQLAERCVARDYATRNVLFSSGDECRGLYVIETGRVRIYRTSPDGKEQVLHVEGPGRPVAELPLFDGGTYPASAMTVEPSRLIFLARTAFETTYRTHPDVAHA